VLCAQRETNRRLCVVLFCWSIRLSEHHLNSNAPLTMRKHAFYRAAMQFHIGKMSRAAFEDVVLQLVANKYHPVSLCYISRKKSIEFTTATKCNKGKFRTSKSTQPFRLHSSKYVRWQTSLAHETIRFEIETKPTHFKTCPCFVDCSLTTTWL